MTIDKRRLIEDIAIAKTVIDTSEIKKKLDTVQKELQEARRQSERESKQARADANRAAYEANEEERQRLKEAQEEEEESRNYEKGQHFFNLAETCFEKEDWSEALQLYEVAKKSFPQSFYIKKNGVFSHKMSVYKMALCLSHLGRYADSLRLFKNLLRDKSQITIDSDYLTVFMKGFNRNLFDVYQLSLKSLNETSDNNPKVDSEKRNLKAEMYTLFPQECPTYKSAFSEVTREAEILKNRNSEIKMQCFQITNICNTLKKDLVATKDWQRLMSSVEQRIRQLQQTESSIPDTVKHIINSCKHYTQEFLMLKCLSLTANVDGPITLPERAFLKLWGVMHDFSEDDVCRVANETTEVNLKSFDGDDKGKGELISDLYRCVISDGTATETEMGLITQVAEVLEISSETVADIIKKVLAHPSMTFFVRELAVKAFNGFLPKNTYQGDGIPQDVMMRLKKCIRFPASETIIAAYEEKTWLVEDSLFAIILTDKYVYHYGFQSSSKRPIEFGKFLALDSNRPIKDGSTPWTYPKTCHFVELVCEAIETGLITV